MEMTSASGRLGGLRLIVVLHSTKEPTNEEFGHYIELVRQFKEECGGDLSTLRTFVVTDGGAPNAEQRALMKRVHDGKPGLIAAVTDLSNPFLRGAVAAISWFNPKLSAVGVPQWRDALNHLGLGDHDVEPIVQIMEDLLTTMAPHRVFAEFKKQARADMLASSPSLAAPSAVVADDQLIDGKYRIVRRIGEGGMGAVYEARHQGTDRLVAVKVISGEAIAKGAGARERFEREARATGAIETQHIALTLDTGIDAATGHPYLVMEYLRGEDLQALLARVGALEPDVALRLLVQACIGIAEAHKAGIVHRDLKPANLFLARRDAGEVIVKILDFGIAKMKADRASEDGRKVTKTGTMLGSPLYMSPEQARGDKNIDARSDVWSLGVVLYEALSGATPHGNIDTVGGLIIAISTTPAPALKEVAPWVDPKIAALVHRALAIDPNERYGSVSELVDALRVHLPSGWTVNESMLRGVSEALRGSAHTKAKLGLAKTSAAPPGQDKGSAARTTDGISRPRSVSRGKPGRGARIAAVLTFLFGVVGFTAWRLSERKAVPLDSSTLAATPKNFALTIVPVEVTVEVDGKPAITDKGLLTITGRVGDTHHVRVSMGATERTVVVTLSESGAVPPRIDLSDALSR
jgi:serine/threonine-protein kinase